MVASTIKEIQYRQAIKNSRIHKMDSGIGAEEYWLQKCFHLLGSASVLQDETFAIRKAAKYLLERGLRNAKVTFFSNGKAAINSVRQTCEIIN